MPPSARQVDDGERRSRLARRHAVAPHHRVADVEAAVGAMTVFQATEAATVHLSALARVDGLTIADVDLALYESRTLVKQLAMRRTLFVFPIDLLGAALGAPAARVASAERRRVAKELVASGLTDDGERWLDAAKSAVVAHLDGGMGLSAQEIREQVPEVHGTIARAPGTKWGRDIQMAPWVLAQLGLDGQIVRGRNRGHWRLARHEWTLMSSWLGAPIEPFAPADGYAALVRRWLHTFGPGTATDLQWWLGSTKSAVMQALHEIGATEVALDGGGIGWLAADDLETEPTVEPWAALLPVLDPTTMGWKERDFYLAPEHVPYLFDTVGNGGSTAWWDGRIVGCWVQDEDGVVRVVLREDVGADGRTALDVEAARLTDWLDGVRISSVYTSAQMKGARLP